MCTVRFEDLIIATEGFTEAQTPQMNLYKSRVQTYPYVPQVPCTGCVENQTYRAAILENSFLKVIVLPELGGRVYSIFDKVANQELFYKNPKILMRLIAPRGAWFAGGIEYNFPVGHALHTSTLVNVQLVQNESEASVLLSNKDRVTGLTWAVKHTLRENERMLKQDVTLENATYMSQPFDFWTNAAVPVTPKTVFIYPTREVISDEYAGPLQWPTHQGVYLSDYTQVKRPSSFFSVQPEQDYFGVFYPEQSVGVLHFSRRLDLPGAKLFTWGNNGDGQMWYHLLCADGQPYAEIQGGLPIDQSERAMLAPFSQITFTEWWVPIDSLQKPVLSPVNGKEITISQHNIQPENKTPESNFLPQKNGDSKTLWSKYIRAYEQETQFKYAETVDLLEEILNDNPDFALARVALARVRLRQGEKTRVEVALKPVLSVLPRFEPTRIEAVYLHALSNFQVYSSEQFIANISDLAMVPEYKSRIVLLLAEALIKEKRFEEAELLLKDVLSQQILEPASRSKASILLWRISGHDPEVLGKYYDHLSTAELAFVAVESQLFGNLSEMKEQMIATDTLLQIACEYSALDLNQPLIDVILPVCPETISFFYLKANAFHSLGCTDERDEVLKSIFTTGNDFPWEREVIQSIENAICVNEVENRPSGQHHYWLAHYYEATGRLADALVEYEKAQHELEEPSAVRYVCVRQASIWNRLGDSKKTQYYVRKAATMKGELDSHILVELDTLLQAFDSLDLRANLLNGLHVDHSELNVHKIDYLIQNGEIDAAIYMIETSRFDFHEGQFWPRAYFMKAYVLKAIDAMESGKLDQAVPFIQAAYDYPLSFGIGTSEGIDHTEQLDYLMGLIYRRLGKHDEASQWFQRVAEANVPRFSELYYYKLASAKYLNQQDMSACEEWSHAIATQSVPQSKRNLLIGLSDLLSGHQGAASEIRDALEMEQFTRENWFATLREMNELIPELRSPAVIWEAFLLELMD